MVVHQPPRPASRASRVLPQVPWSLPLLPCSAFFTNCLAKQPFRFVVPTHIHTRVANPTLNSLAVLQVVSFGSTFEHLAAAPIRARDYRGAAQDAVAGATPTWGATNLWSPLKVHPYTHTHTHSPPTPTLTAMMRAPPPTGNAGPLPLPHTLRQGAATAHQHCRCHRWAARQQPSGGAGAGEGPSQCLQCTPLCAGRGQPSEQACVQVRATCRASTWHRSAKLTSVHQVTGMGGRRRE